MSGPGPSGISDYRQQFADPFSGIASANMPTSWKRMLYKCEEIWLDNGAVKMALERVLSYFVTQLDVEADDEVKKKYTELLEEKMGILTVLHNLLRDRNVYGIGFASLHVPFRRFLSCPKCGAMHPFKLIGERPEFKFKWANFQFQAKCQNKQCGYGGVWRIVDNLDDLENRLRVRLWSPHQIEIVHDPASGEDIYLWRIDEVYKQKIRTGSLHHLEHANLQVIEAIRTNKMFEFHPDVLFCLKEQSLSGIRSHGYGIPRIIHNWRQIYLNQIVKRQIEALASDYITPLRMLMPAARAGSGGPMARAQDPLMGVNLQDFAGVMQKMIRSRRRNPTDWQVMAYPVDYRVAGAEANQFIPAELMQQCQADLLNELGVPPELFNGTMQLQSAPLALRLFEATWYHIVRDANRFLVFLVKHISELLSWEAVKVTLRKSTYLDDPVRQQLLSQLSAAQQISGQGGLEELGKDWKVEQQRISDEALFKAKLQQEQQEQIEELQLGAAIAQAQPQTAGQGGAAPAQGDPSQGMMAPPQPVTDYFSQAGADSTSDVESLTQDAESISSSLLGLPATSRNSQLRILKQRNPTLHALVTASLRSSRSQASSQGRDQVLQQQFGAGAAA